MTTTPTDKQYRVAWTFPINGMTHGNAHGADLRRELEMEVLAQNNGGEGGPFWLEARDGEGGTWRKVR